jgi:uncharacterized protein
MVGEPPAIAVGHSDITAQRRWRRALIFGAALVAALIAARSSNAAEPLTIKDPGTYVVDTAHVLKDDARRSLENLLAELDRATTAQVKVLTVPNLGGEDIFSFAQRQFQLWKLGQKGKNNGALIVLAVADRKVRIHTGYGLEGALPDSWIGSLSREIAADYFKQGKLSEGLYRLTVAVVNQIADDAGVKIAGAPNVRHVAPRGSNSGMVAIAIIVMVIWFAFVVFRSRRGGKRRGATNWWMGPGGFGGFGGSTGGFGGGSFGGSFGGGSFGGGSFGGGGSSGGGGGGASW